MELKYSNKRSLRRQNQLQRRLDFNSSFLVETIGGFKENQELGA